MKLHRMLRAILTGPSVTRHDKVCHKKTINNSKKLTLQSYQKFTDNTKHWTLFRTDNQKVWWATMKTIFLLLWSQIIFKIWGLSNTSMIVFANISRTFVPLEIILVFLMLPLILIDSTSSNNNPWSTLICKIWILIKLVAIITPTIKIMISKY